MLKYEKIIILAPHTDDGAFGCGGSVSRFREKGAELFYAAFSPYQESLPRGLRNDILEKELMEATEALSIRRSNVLMHRYPVRRYAEHRHEILEDLV